MVAPLPEVVEYNHLLLQVPGQTGRLLPLAAAADQLGNQVGHRQVQVGQVGLVLLQSQQVILHQWSGFKEIGTSSAESEPTFYGRIRKRPFLVGSGNVLFWHVNF